MRIVVLVVSIVSGIIVQSALLPSSVASDAHPDTSPPLEMTQPDGATESAKAPAEALRLDAVVAEALARNPELKMVKERLAAATLRIPQASALPDPSVGYTIMGPNFVETRTGPQDQVYEAEQMVPFPGKLWEKRRMAVAEAKATEAQLKAVEREVILKATDVYADLYAMDESLRAVEEIKELLSGFEAIAQARYASEGGSQGEVAKAQTEVSGTLQRLFVLRQQRQTAAARLNALLDRSPHALVGQPMKPDMPTLSFTLEELLDLAKHHRPELTEASAIVKRDTHANTLAKFEYVPDVSVGFQYIQVGGGMTSDPDDGKDVWMVPLKITIPLWQNRLLPALREAKRNLRASQAQLEQTQNLTEYEVKDAFYRFTTAKQIVELHETALIPEADLAFSSDRASYEAGRIGALNLIDSARVSLNTRVSYYEAVAGALKSFAALERVVGIDLTRQGGSP